MLVNSHSVIGCCVRKLGSYIHGNHYVKLNLRIEKLHVRFRELERAREVGVNTGNGFVVEMLV